MEEEGAEEGEEEEERVEDGVVEPEETPQPTGVHQPEVGNERNGGSDVMGETAEGTGGNEIKEDKNKHEKKDEHVPAAAPMNPIPAPADPSSAAPPTDGLKNASI